MNESVVMERIVHLRKIRAGHIGEMTKISKRMEKYLKDHKFCSDVRYEKQRLETQWRRYCSVYEEMLELLSDVDRIEESTRHRGQEKSYEELLQSVEEYLIAEAKRESEMCQGQSGALDELTGFREHVQATNVYSSRGTDDDVSAVSSRSRGYRKSTKLYASSRVREEDDLEKFLCDKSNVNNQVVTSLFASRDMDDEVRSSVSTFSSRCRGCRVSSTSSIAQEKEKLERILAEKGLSLLKASKKRRLKLSQINLENEKADAQDMAEIAKTRDDFFENRLNNHNENHDSITEFDTAAAVKSDLNENMEKCSTAQPIISSTLFTPTLHYGTTIPAQGNQHVDSSQFDTAAIVKSDLNENMEKCSTAQPIISSTLFTPTLHYGTTIPAQGNQHVDSSQFDTAAIVKSDLKENVEKCSTAQPIISSTLFTPTQPYGKTIPIQGSQHVDSSQLYKQDKPRLHINEDHRADWPKHPPSNIVVDSLQTYSSDDSSATERAMEKITSGIDSIVVRSSLPPLDVVKFSGDPHEYYRFKSRFHEMVDSQNISDAQKMSRLLQFLDGRARKAVSGFEGVPGGLYSALKLLEQRFGQPHIIAKSCVDALVNVPNISSSNGQALQEFADRARTMYETLKALNALQEMNMSNLSKMSGRLPVSLQIKWRDEVQRLREKGKVPDLEDLVKFIERKADAASDPVFGRIGETHKTFHNPTRSDRRPPQSAASPVTPKTTTMMMHSTSPSEQQGTSNNSNKSSSIPDTGCFICGSTHKIENCQEFASKSVRQRIQMARQKGLCLNCLRKGHFVAQCQSKFTCKECKQQHHSLLHKSSEMKESDKKEEPTPTAKPVNNYLSKLVNVTRPANQTTPAASKRVALQVVPIKVFGDGHKSTSMYALLDTGSEDTFISKAIADKLGVQVNNFGKVSVCTLSGESTVRIGHVDLKVKGVDNQDKNTITIKDVKVIDNLSIDTSRPKDLSKWSHLNDIVIPDVDVNEVLMLIGANVPEAQMHIEYRMGKPGEPYGVRTLLGWAVLGPVDNNNICDRPKVNVNHVKFGEVSDQQMSQFLRLEDIEMNKTSKQAMSIEDKESLRRMDESVRLVDGHYEVGMLWKSEHPWLPNNRMMAEARLRSLKRRLQNDEGMHEKYKEFMNNVLSKGYAKKLTAEEARTTSSKTWYLPHHGVFHPQKKDKLRVVFDAAAQHNGVSLNNQLNHGPDLSNSLFGILLRFRQEPVALVADIEGMFNQVKVPVEDADALRFLWWEDSNLEEVSEFQMTTHIFGAADSPSCANYCLKRAAEDNKDHYSEEAVSTIKNDFYVDDLVKSVGTVEDARSLSREVTELLRSAGFRLTKWMSNRREVLASIPDSERSQPTLDLDLDELPIQRTLGVLWDVQKDVFTFKISEINKPATKRGIHSTVSSLYDPIGFVSPVLLEAKKLLQKLWKLNLGWDEPIPQVLERQWNKWKQELASLSELHIPRVYLIAETDVVDTSLHVFADASEDGYGMCAYLRFLQANNVVKCAFLVGRSRSSPVRPISIPRLELQAATLAVRVYRTLIDELTCSIDRAIFWTDSQTTLQYINNVTKRFQVYVANRVAEIREVTTPKQWRHCPGKLNPADDASRGLSPKKLSTDQHRWWKGPDFLLGDEESWPDTKVKEVCDDDPELRKEVKVHQTSTKTNINDQGLKTMIERCSSWARLQRRVAWLVRFCHYIAKKKTNSYEKGPLTLKELNEATCVIVKVIQAEAFSEELSDIKTKGEVKRNSSIADLRPVIQDDVLRVGGRLQNATELSLDEKHPMILPKKHHLSNLIIRHYHENTAHSGREQTLCESRRQFWIVCGRSLVKNTVRTCIKCRRVNARRLEQVMGPLPKARLEAYRPPFTHTGVDLFGPLLVKLGRGTAKRWGCLFTCLNTRAVYLEVVPSLEADDFIMVLRQFVSRRGPPKEMWSDRGTNFVGADRELRDAIAQWNERIESQLQQKGIKWMFQPPASPHMSGVWERLVKITKKHLKAVVGDKLLNDLELRTFLAEVEFIVNNRPITAVSDDPTDLAALTPNHFLLQRTAQLPPGVFIKEDQFSRRRWRMVQFLINCYWQRWIKEYLPNLQRRSKWLTSKKNLQVGDLVLVADDNVSRSRWPLARVQDVFMGRDNRVRSANIKTATGVLHRPIAKLCLLEEAD